MVGIHRIGIGPGIGPGIDGFERALGRGLRRVSSVVSGVALDVV